MDLKAFLFALGLIVLLQLAQSMHFDKNDTSSEDYQSRFKKVHLSYLIEKHNWLLSFLEDTKKITSKVHALRPFLNSQDHVHSEYLAHISTFMESMEKFDHLNHTASILLLTEYIENEALAENKKAALTQYFLAMEDALRDGVEVLKYSKMHFKDLPEEFSFLGDEIEFHFKKFYMRFDELYERIHSQLQLFVSSLSNEEKQTQRDVVDLCEEYRNTSTKDEMDLMEKRRGMETLLPLNLELEIKQAE